MPIGNLHAGDTRFKPRAEVMADDILSPALREDVRQRLQKFVDRAITAAIEPLFKLEEAEGLEGTMRGLAYRLAENFGVIAARRRDGGSQGLGAGRPRQTARFWCALWRHTRCSCQPC